MIKPIATRKLIVVLSAIPLVTLFQNCDTGFNLKDGVSLSGPIGAGPIVNEEQVQLGKTLYSSRCAACHQGFEDSTKHRKTASEINIAINSVPSMSFLRVLSESEIRAIAVALNSLTPPTTGGGDGGNGNGNGNGNGTGNGDGGETELPMKYACLNPSTRGIGNTGIRRLTKTEISNSLRDIFGSAIMDKASVKAALASVPSESPGDIVKEFQASHSNQHIESLIGLTEAIAESVMASATDKNRIFGSCASSNLDNNCVTNFISNMGLKIMRRPITDQRRTELLAMYQSASTGDRGLKALLMSMVLAPEFVFHMEMGRTSCTTVLPSPLVVSSTNPFVFFDPDGGTRESGSASLNRNGWLVWQIPASSVGNTYQQVVVTASGMPGANVYPQFSINVNDGAVATDVTVTGSSAEYTFTFAVPKNQAVKVGLYYSNSGNGRTLNVSSVSLKATSNDPNGNCQAIAPNNGRTLLDDYEIASRISYSVIGSTPDSELLQAAANQSLRTIAGVRTQVERLLTNSAARARLDQITDAWLLTNAIPDPNPALASVAGIQANGLKEEAKREVQEYMSYMVLDRQANVKTLMTEKIGFPRTARLASIYGSGIAQGSTPVNLTQGHGGLLLRASVLLSGNVASSPILRGVYVRKRLLCDNLASPDFAVVDQRNQELGIIDRTVYSGRQVAEKITAPQACASCHTSINPLGFALEAFDPLGKARTEELVYNGMGQVIARHNLDLSVVDAFIEGVGKKPLAGAQDLLDGIANSSKIRSCISERFYSHARLRSISNSTDGCALLEVETALAQGLSVKEAFIRSIANEDIFWRKAIGGQ